MESETKTCDVLSLIFASKDLLTHFSTFLTLRVKAVLVNLICRRFQALVACYRPYLYLGGPLVTNTATVHYDMDWMGTADVPLLFHIEFVVAAGCVIDPQRIRIILRNNEVWTEGYVPSLTYIEQQQLTATKRGFTFAGKSLIYTLTPVQIIDQEFERLICEPSVTEIADSEVEGFKRARDAALFDFFIDPEDVKLHWSHGSFTLDASQHNQNGDYPELFIDRNVEFNQYAKCNDVDCWIGYEDEFGMQICIPSPLTLHVEYVGYFCFFGGCSVEVLSSQNRRETKRVDEVQIGDYVRSSNTDSNSFTRVMASVRTQRRTNHEVFEMIQVGETILTRGHPIRLCDASKWIRPETVGVHLANLQADEVFNFVLEEPNSIIVNGLECSSLGQFCEGVDGAKSFFGSFRVIESLKRNPQWPTVTLQGPQYTHTPPLSVSG